VRAVIDNNLFVSGLLWGDKGLTFDGIPIIDAAEALR
jgi:hypothetical protein